MSKFLLFGFIGRACVFSVCVDLRRAPRDLADPHDRTAAMPDARSPQLQHHHEHHTEFWKPFGEEWSPPASARSSCSTRCWRRGRSVAEVLASNLTAREGRLLAGAGDPRSSLDGRWLRS